MTEEERENDFPFDSSAKNSHSILRLDILVTSRLVPLVDLLDFHSTFSLCHAQAQEMEDDYSDILRAVSTEPYARENRVHYTNSDRSTLYDDRAQSPYHDYDEEKGAEEEDSFEGYEEKVALSPGTVQSPFSAYEGAFGLPPSTAQLRRNKTNRRVKLTHGNLILDCLIPTRLQGFLPRTDDDEFKCSRSVYSQLSLAHSDPLQQFQIHCCHLRSTPFRSLSSCSHTNQLSLCQPEDFEANRFALRPAMLNRETELMVVVTLYNVRPLFLHAVTPLVDAVLQRRTRSSSVAPCTAS